MDLNWELLELRRLAKRFVDNPGINPIDPEDVLEFAQRFLALDDVITESGIRPNDWDGK